MLSSEHLSSYLTFRTRRHTLKQVVNRSDQLDRVFHAVGDPTRRAMVERLGRGPASVSELAEPLAMSLPAVVQHLGVLEAAGAVSTRKVGRVRTCWLEPAVLRLAEAWLVEQRTDWERRLDRLGAELAGRDKEPPAPTASPKHSKQPKHK
jgi:DNA-binding transcriptional ArsR family regulator